MLEKIKVGKKTIGKGQPVFITVEIGQNHNGRIEVAKKLIDMAAVAEVDAVKFCKRNVDKILSKEALNAPYAGSQSFGKTYGEHRKRLELSDQEYLELADYCRQKGIIFYASVCDEDSTDLLEKCGAPLFKVASRDLVNLPLLEYIAKKNKPVVLSTGMSSEQEIAEAVTTVRKHNKQLLLMHCTSQYPCDYENIYLKQIKYLEEKFDCLVGFSGHSVGILMPILAGVLDAVAVEKHITLSRAMKGTDHAGALELPGLLRVVRDLRNAQRAYHMLPEKRILEAETVAREKLGKSIVARKAIKKGEKIVPEMLCVKGRGLGLTPKHGLALIGREATRDIKPDEMLAFEDVGLTEQTLDREKLNSEIAKFDWTKLLDR